MDKVELHGNGCKVRTMGHQEDYRSMVEDSPAFFSSFLPDGTLTYVNSALAKATGAKAGDLVGRSFFDYLTQDEQLKVRNCLSRLSPERPVESHEQIHILPDGSIRWHEWTNRAFFDDNGIVVHYQAVGQDITRLKDIERKLKLSEEHYRCFANLTSDSIHKCSRAGNDPYRIEWIGGTVGSISGFSAEEIMEMGCYLPIVHDDDRDNLFFELHRMRPGDVKIIEFRIVTKENDLRWIAEKCRCEAGEGDGELVLYGSVRDVTERKEMEQALHGAYAELQRHNNWMVLLNEMNDLLLSVESREEAFAVIGNCAKKLFSPYSGGFAICADDSASCSFVAYWGDEIGTQSTFETKDCWALRRRAPHKVFDPTENLDCKHYHGNGAYPHFCLPIMVRGETLGLLQVVASESVAAKELDELYNIAMTMRESITLALSNLILRETLQKEAIHDPLTGLFNRRYLEETLTLELRNHQRNNEPVVVAMMDLDNFKSFNDEYGHEAGDIVLKEIGALLQRSLRGGDIACRYGGEELTVILGGSTLEHALPRLDSIRQMIMDLDLRCRDQVLRPITVSIGMSEARPNESDPATLLRRADAALYTAKQQGRNRIVVA